MSNPAEVHSVEVSFHLASKLACFKHPPVFFEGAFVCGVGVLKNASAACAPPKVHDYALRINDRHTSTDETAEMGDHLRYRPANCHSPYLLEWHIVQVALGLKLM